MFQLPSTRFAEWPDAGPPLCDAGLTVAALALADDAVPLDVFAAARPRRVALVLGAEGDGLSRRALAASDVVVTIPMAGEWTR